MFNYAIFGLIGSALLLLLVSVQGQCPACNRKYAPVCARSTDGTGKNYDNRCIAECDGHDPASVTEGECPRPCVCTLEWNPVCGSNGVIFGNECQLSCSGYVRGDPSLCPHVSQLPAAVKRRTERRQFCACLSIWSPVCDADGYSYSNTCVAKCAGHDEDSVSAEQCNKKK